MRIAIAPTETDTILFIDSYTVLAFPFSMKLFKSITRWNTNIVQRDRSIEHPKFSEGNSLHFSWQFLREFASEYLFRFLAFE
jgi:hypothetical protein